MSEIIIFRDPNELKVVHGVSYTQEIRTLGHLLDVKKKAAIRDEDFEKAKRLKFAIEKLHMVSIKGYLQRI